MYTVPLVKVQTRAQKCFLETSQALAILNAFIISDNVTSNMLYNSQFGFGNKIQFHEISLRFFLTF